MVRLKGIASYSKNISSVTISILMEDIIFLAYMKWILLYVITTLWGSILNQFITEDRSIPSINRTPRITGEFYAESKNFLS